MKFAEHLGAHITPEWRKQYIRYEDMKQMLYKSIDQIPSIEMEGEENISRFKAKLEETFFHFCDSELTKINTFFSEKLAEATRRVASLKGELVAWKESKEEGAWLRWNRPRRHLKLAFSELYLSLILLQNYQTLNFTGFRKILKKHDKLMNNDSGYIWLKENVQLAPFYLNKDIDKLIIDTESTVIQQLENGDRQRAMKRLRVPPLGDERQPWTTFKMGFFMGACMILLIAFLIPSYYPYLFTLNPALTNESPGGWRIAFRLYRGPFLLIMFLFLLGINIYGWRSSGVNHVLIFELDPRNHVSEQQIIELAALLGVFWCLSIIFFLHSQYLGIPPFIHPMLLMSSMLCFLFNPLPVCQHGSRLWLLRVLGRVIAAPFFHVGFADFWLADQLNSLVTALLDFQYTICFFSTNDGDFSFAHHPEHCVGTNWIVRPIVACLPAWFRFAQCLRRYHDTHEAFPHVVNAVKYGTTFFVSLFSSMYYNNKEVDENPMSNPYFYIWIVAAAFSSLYGYTWDIKMDWGLTEVKHNLLREEIVYPSKIYYYTAIIEDLLLRFGWVLTVSLTEMGFAQGDLIITIVGPLEVLRRFIWNFFRLENEHLNNCGKFRAVRDISIVPIRDSDQALMIKLMDDENGIINVRRRKMAKRKGEYKTLIEIESADDPSTFSSPYNTISSLTSNRLYQSIAQRNK